ncbi:Kinesin family member c3 [Fasciola hepatica]|uniref:Kinesin-like protein n=1 Tax=Fasciola hepatica TaxID=6192 RepID=A0A2H1C7Z0_FASHE|nr:Kinesin family member c3 [Fasciola hepatica]
MNKEQKPIEDQFYRAPPGYASARRTTTPAKTVAKVRRRPRSADSKPGRSGDTEEIDMDELCKAISSSRLKSLQMKQNVMETFMRKLLQSMKELKEVEAKRGRSISLDKQRRLKLTRMLQILMLQRRNLQLQTDTLQKAVLLLSRKHAHLKQRADTLVHDYTTLKKEYTQMKSDLEFKEIQIDSLLQNKATLQKQVETHTTLRIQTENAQFELKRLRVENENLKEALQQLEVLLRNKVQEREELELKNSQLQQELDGRDAEDANMRVRSERLTCENQTLRQELAQYKAGRTDAHLISAEAERVRERLGQLQRDYLRLQRLYAMEAETRKMLHNQLQEVRGNLRVLCRCRPPASGEPCLVQFNSLDRITVPSVIRGNSNTYQRHLGVDPPAAYLTSEESFTFNRVFRPGASQLDVFEEIRPLIASCVDGYNVCIMAYGPTGSGKTYTMQGVQKDPGVGMRAVSELFELCQPLQGIWEVQVSIAMLEIHNEVVYDLLGDQIRPVKLSDDGTEIRLIDAEEKVATNEQDMLFWIAKGHKRRKVTATKLNVESSRSHHIIRLQLVLQSLFEKTRRSSSLILCDLAGSESAERIEASGEIHIETGFINKSLVTLARVFEALRRRNQGYSTNAPMVPIPAPYRDSKLTHLLKPCLGGQAKCVLIITISGEASSIDRSLKALEFGQQAMQISLGPARPNERILTSWYSKKRVRSTEPNSQSMN